ncbi:DUF1822 family protein [Candidatus Halobeggiatoa sp. HSG11]|nr:DUF1822 family protein [Candidatus Halobeggiatoa sp. HSG11]
MQTNKDLTEEEFDVIWDILGGNPAPDNANPNIVLEAEAFRGGLIAAMENPAPKRVNLTQWLKGKFTDTVEIGWQTLEEVFHRPVPAFMAGVEIKRAKRIDLNKEQTVILIIELKELEDKQLKVIFQVRVTGEQDYLPTTLKLTVTDQSANKLEVSAGEQDDYLEQEWLFENGENFRVTLNLNDIEITEFFSI